MSRALAPVTFVTLFMVALQLTVFSSMRITGVVVMLVWLWPFCVGLMGSTPLAVWSAIVSGTFFDTHALTPFGLTAVVGVLLAYVASRLGKEGVGDLDSAAWWVTPVLAATAGFLAPAIYVAGGLVELNFSLWHSNVLDMMLVNAVAFAVLSRPVARLASAISGKVRSRW